MGTKLEFPLFPVFKPQIKQGSRNSVKVYGRRAETIRTDSKLWHVWETSFLAKKEKRLLVTPNFLLYWKSNQETLKYYRNGIMSAEQYVL